MRVALVYPEVMDLARFKEARKEFPPFGPLYLAAVMEAAGHHVRLFKAEPSTRAFDFSEFDVVGFSISASATYGTLLRVRRQSIYADNAFLLAGGVHANLFPERTLMDFQVHAVGIGEGEATILDLLAGWPDVSPLSVNGVCAWRDGAPARSPPRQLMKSIDGLPHPARHLMPTTDFLMSDRLARTDLRLAHVMFSRGCPFPCTFCASAHTQTQVRSGSSARAELIQLKDKYDIEGFAIVDDNFVVARKKVTEIANCITDLNLKWSALSRVDTVDEALLRTMRDSGCIELKFGVESGSERILRAMRKNTTQTQIKQAIQIASNLGIDVKAFVVHGYPGENLESTQETIKLLDSLSGRISRVSVFRFVPLPGTEAYNTSAQLGIRGTDKDADWDGDWERYHIHHNNRHWWGTEAEFEVLNTAHAELTSFVEARWPERHSALAV